MPPFSGVNHFALSVTDVEVSERFYTDVLGLLTVLDIGHGRVCMHTASGFTIALLEHADRNGAAFTERNTGLDHIGLAATNRAELEAWQGWFASKGVTFTPIQDTALGHHLNFRDPDGIALEFQAPTDVYAAAVQDLRSRKVSDAEVLAVAKQLLGPDLVPQPE